MLLTGRDPDDVSFADFFHRITPPLHAAHAFGHNQRLPQRVSMPCSVRPGIERDQRAACAARSTRYEQGINTHLAGKVLGRPWS